MADEPNPAQRLLAFFSKPIPAIIAVAGGTAGILRFMGQNWDLIAIAMLVLLLAIGIFLLGIWFVKRKHRAQVDSAISGMSDSIKAQDDSPQARERCARLREKWESTFRSKNPELIRSEPLLMIVGESKSGKSVLLDRSGLGEENNVKNREKRDWEDGTENVDPWFFDKGVVLDTAGEMVAPSAGSARIDWAELIKLIKRMRPRNPVSGVVLAVPAWRLFHPDENERIRQANLFQREFQNLVHGFGVRFPVSVVVTMSDLIDGFDEFALRQNASRPGDSYTMFGWSQFKLRDELGADRAMAEAVSTVRARVEAQVLHDTCNPEVASLERREALEFWRFPGELGRIGQRLESYLRVVFKENKYERIANAPFFRGVFFGSSMQTVRKGEPRRKEPEKPSSDPFYIKDLLAVRLFGEAGLVTTSPRAEAAARFRRFVGVVVPCVAAAISISIATVAFSLAGHLRQDVEALQTLALALKRDDDIRGIVARQAGWWSDGRVTVGPWSEWIGPDGSVQQKELARLRGAFLDAHPGFAADSGPGSDEPSRLPWYLAWYRPFERVAQEDREDAVRRAWCELVAEPLLGAAVGDKGLGGDGSAYATARLAASNPENSAPGTELSAIDRGLFLSLETLKGDRAPMGLEVSIPPAGLPPVPQAPDALVLADGRGRWNLPTPGDGRLDLVPVWQAMFPSEATGDFGGLLQFPVGGEVTDRVKNLAKRVDEIRQEQLKVRLAREVQPLLDAATASKKWMGQDNDDPAKNWMAFISSVDVEQIRGQPGSTARLDALSKALGKDPATFLVSVANASRDQSEGKVTAINRLDDLVGRTEALRQSGNGVLERLRNLSSLDLLRDDLKVTLKSVTKEGQPDEAGDKAVRKYLEPVLSQYYALLADRLGNWTPPAFSPSPEELPGILGPIVSGAEACRKATEEIDNAKKADGRASGLKAEVDGLAIHEKYGLEREGTPVREFLDRLDAYKGEIGKSMVGMPVDRIDQLNDAKVKELVNAVLSPGGPAANAVDQVAKAIDVERKRRSLQACDVGSPAGRPETEQGEAKQSREKLRTALARLIKYRNDWRTNHPSVSLDDRTIAGVAIAEDAWPFAATKPEGPDGNPISDVVNELERTADGSPLPESERRYWSLFWGDVLNIAKSKRDAEAASFATFEEVAAKRFPLAKTDSAELSATELDAFLDGRLPGSKEGDLPEGWTAPSGRVWPSQGAPFADLSGVNPSRGITDRSIAVWLAPPEAMRRPQLETAIYLTGEERDLPEELGEIDIDDPDSVLDGGVVFASIAAGKQPPKTVEKDKATEIRTADAFVEEGIPRLGEPMVLTVGVSPDVRRYELGNTWAGLRLATKLAFLPGREKLAGAEDGSFWGLMKFTCEGQELSMPVRIRLQWIETDQNGANTPPTPIDIEAWRAAWSRAR